MTPTAKRLARKCQRGAPGDLTEFDPIAKAKLIERTKKLCDDLGYYSAQFRLEIVPEPARGRADLIVDVTNLGPAAVVGEIEITGNVRNSREAILGFLDLQPGAPSNFAHRSRLAFDLWRSARFDKCQVPAPAPPAPDGKVKLAIDVTEDADAPLLSERFPRKAQALLAARDWLSDFDQRNEDALLRVQTQTYRLEAVLSWRKGLSVQIWLPGQANFAGPPDYALVAHEKNLGLYSFRHRAKAIISTPWAIEAHLKVLKHGLSFGTGFRSTDDLPAFHLDLNLPPVNCPLVVSKLHDKYGFEFAWNGDELTMPL